MSAAREYMKSHPPELEVQIFRMTEQEFARQRMANQSIAGHAARHGVWMSKERTEYSYEYQDEYPAHWPATKNSLENGWEALREMQEKVVSRSWNQKSIGYNSQQAVKNGLKSLLSLHQDKAEFRHDLRAIWSHYFHRYHDPENPEAEAVRETVEELLEHTSYDSPDEPGRKECWLTDYARQYRYRQDYPRMPEHERQDLKVRVEDAFYTIMLHVMHASGTTEEDLFTEGKPWENPEFPGVP